MYLLSKIYYLKSTIHSRRGQTLVETMVALSVLTMGFLGSFTLLSNSISTNRVVTDNHKATYLASEGIEIVKNLIDTNILQLRPWNDRLVTAQFNEYELDYESTFPLSDYEKSGSGEFLKYDSVANTYGYTNGENTVFKRTVRIELIGTDEVKVNSIVKWLGRGDGASRGDYEVNIEDHFMNWRTPPG